MRNENPIRRLRFDIPLEENVFLHQARLKHHLTKFLGYMPFYRCKYQRPNQSHEIASLTLSPKNVNSSLRSPAKSAIANVVVPLEFLLIVLLRRGTPLATSLLNPYCPQASTDLPLLVPLLCCWRLSCPLISNDC